METGPLLTIDADPVQIRQLFQNLIGNALKFKKDDVAPVVTISCASEVDGKPGQCRLTVSDNGIGFDMKYKERIFGVFQRLHGRGAYEGSGVGLAICSRIVTRHRGTLDVDSAVGEGTTFTIDLPCRQEGASDEPPAE